jgi:hypothetical protein
MHTSLPPDINPPVEATHENILDAFEVQEEVVAREEEEMEADVEEAEDEADNLRNVKDDAPPNGMPGKLPTEKEQPLCKN